MWVPPFRYLRISGYVLLPAAFRSLSRLSSALSAKASTLRSFLLNLASPFLSYIALYRRGPLRFALPVCFPQAGKFASFSLSVSLFLSSPHALACSPRMSLLFFLFDAFNIRFSGYGSDMPYRLISCRLKAPSGLFFLPALSCSWA